MNVFFLAILLAPIYAEHDDLTLQQRNGVRVTKVSSEFSHKKKETIDFVFVSLN